MILFLKTLRTYILWGIVSLFFILICIPLVFFPYSIRYDNKFYFFLINSWNRLLIFFSFILVRIQGLNNIPKFPDNPSIIIANHASALDIFLLESIIGSYPHVWMCKDSYSKIPLFNILVKQMAVPVKRENPMQALRALGRVLELARGRARHVILFPEGKRYSDGKIHNFLRGFAILAKKLNRPVMPVAIHGVNKIFSKKSLYIDSRASDVKLIVGEPLIYSAGETEKEFTKRVQGWFSDTLEGIR